MLARMSSAGLAHTNGRGASFLTARNSRIADSRAAVLRCDPRRTHLSVSSANSRSTRFSHDPYVGVKCTWNRGRLANQRRIAGVLWVP